MSYAGLRGELPEKPNEVDYESGIVADFLSVASEWYQKAPGQYPGAFSSLSIPLR